MKTIRLLLFAILPLFCYNYANAQSDALNSVQNAMRDTVQPGVRKTVHDIMQDTVQGRMQGSLQNTAENTGRTSDAGHIDPLTGNMSSGNTSGYPQYTVSDDRNTYGYQENATFSVVPGRNGNKANIYPMPAQEHLHLDVTLNTIQPLRIIILDMQGLVYYRHDEPECNTFSTVINLEKVPSGNYFIKIIGTSSYIGEQFLIAKSDLLSPGVLR